MHNAMLARYMLSSCVSVRPSVCHKLMFYENGYT